MKKQTKPNGNQELQKKCMTCRAKYQYPTPETPVMAQKEMNVIQKLAKLVNELRGYIEYVEMVQSRKDPVYLDFDAVARKAGMASRRELNVFLNTLAGLPDIAETK